MAIRKRNLSNPLSNSEFDVDEPKVPRRTVTKKDGVKTVVINKKSGDTVTKTKSKGSDGKRVKTKTTVTAAQKAAEAEAAAKAKIAADKLNKKNDAVFAKKQAKKSTLTEKQQVAKNRKEAQKDPSGSRSNHINDYLKTLDKNSAEYKETMKWVNKQGIRL